MTSSEADAVVRRITARHAKVDDPRREQLGTDPRDVLDYLQRYGHTVPRWVQQADVTDSLILGVALWWDDRRRLRRTLHRGRSLGLFLGQLGAPMGIRTPQGTQDLIDRLDALMAYDRPDEQLSRAARRAAAADHDAARYAWVELHREQIAGAAAGLLAAADRYGLEEREWIDELGIDHADGEYTPGSIGVLGLAAGEVRTAPAVVALDTPHGVHRVLVAAERLRSGFARLS